MPEPDTLQPIRFDRFRECDTDSFLTLATEEGWICDRWEFGFHLRTFPAGCLAARTDKATAGYVTSIPYGSSGWIGNLLVSPHLRGLGIGKALMGLALDALGDAGVETVWLTASEAGRPIYEKLGFRAVDTIQRWVGSGTDGPPQSLQSPSLAEIEAADAAGWGSQRRTLLLAVTGRGELVGDGDCFLTAQQCGNGIQLGPWGGCSEGRAELLLGEARRRAGCGTRIFLDSPQRNTVASSLLTAHSFSIKGSTLLMRRGPDPGYRPELVFALGSMGSMG